MSKTSKKEARRLAHSIAVTLLQREISAVSLESQEVREAYQRIIDKLKGASHVVDNLELHAEGTSTLHIHEAITD